MSKLIKQTLVVDKCLSYQANRQKIDTELAFCLFFYKTLKQIKNRFKKFGKQNFFGRTVGTVSKTNYDKKKKTQIKYIPPFL